MNDEAGFLAKILSEPDEDTHRLVYADWLEENDQPERAEFIRGQMEIAAIESQQGSPRFWDALRSTHLSSKHCGSGCTAWCRLHRRQRQLIDRSAVMGSGAMAVYSSDWHLGFWLDDDTDRSQLKETVCGWSHRGFVSEVVTSAPNWIMLGDVLRSRYPITKVKLTTAPDWFTYNGQRTSTGGQFGMIVAGVDLSITIPEGEDCAIAFLVARWPGVTFELPA